MIRSAVYSLRCALVALLALSIVSTQPAMMLSHASEAMPPGCGMSMAAHHSSRDSERPRHQCPSTDDRSCCSDCLSACIVGAGAGSAVITLAATYSYPLAVSSRFTEVVRERKALALRLPPPIGPPLFTRS
ncbi:MAG: hypothetical protein M3Y05_12780 [Gemmatimonadota bacterium]|nr:hypothetical protein [Gemmatimonadota bacterium]